MADSPTRKQKAYLQMRASPEMKARFDAACEYKGWKMQKALERIIEQWVLDIEAEQRDSKKLRSPSRPSLDDFDRK